MSWRARVPWSRRQHHAVRLTVQQARVVTHVRVGMRLAQLVTTAPPQPTRVRPDDVHPPSHAPGVYGAPAHRHVAKWGWWKLSLRISNVQFNELKYCRPFSRPSFAEMLCYRTVHGRGTLFSFQWWHARPVRIHVKYVAIIVFMIFTHAMNHQRAAWQHE